jgi:hypothetical protein
MANANTNPIKICNLLQGGIASECIIYEMQTEFLIWTWFDKYIVHHPKMAIFCELQDIHSIPGIKTLFNRSKKLRDDINFRPQAQKYFKMCFKSRKFTLRLDHGDISVISKVSDYETLSKSLKGFYLRLHHSQSEIFRKYKYHTLLEDEDEQIYVLYGPLSYVNHSCTAIVRLAPPNKGKVTQIVELQIPIHMDDVNCSIMPEENCRNIRLVITNKNVETNKKKLNHERELAAKLELNPFGKKLTGTTFENEISFAVVKDEEFKIRYANYIPRTWFNCICKPEHYCCQYDYRYIEHNNDIEPTKIVEEKCFKRTRLG